MGSVPDFNQFIETVREDGQGGVRIKRIPITALLDTAGAERHEAPVETVLAAYRDVIRQQRFTPADSADMRAEVPKELEARVRAYVGSQEKVVADKGRITWREVLDALATGEDERA